jgi:hypothetical protein
MADSPVLQVFLPRSPIARQPFTMNWRFLPAMLLLSSPVLPQASLADAAPHMTVVEKQDISGTVYKKLGLPERRYCWDACLKEDLCTGVRWGVIQGDTAGLCLLLKGTLTLKPLVTPKTEDGKPIRVISARKDAASAH